MATDNARQFSIDVNKFAKKLVPEKLVQLQKKIVFEALSRIVKKTPIDTGRAVGNWQVTIGTKAGGTVDIEGKSSSDVIAEGMKVLTRLKPYQVVYITNNVNYIVYLEGGSSKKAPHGMVAITVEELRAMFK